MNPNPLFGFGPEFSDPAVPVESLVEGNTAFAFDLYAHLKGRPGNLFFSPFSISACLGMTCAGARGDTETQMGRVLHFSTDQRQMHSSFGELQRQLLEYAKPKVVQIQHGPPNISGLNRRLTEEFVQPPGIKLDIANALWAQEGHSFLPAFLQIATGEYQANVNQADFMTSDASADAVRREINRWVAQKTRDKIQNILPSGSVDVLTRLVLANAIYFKGAWPSPFEEAATSTQPFHLSTNRQIDVHLMGQTDDFKYTGNNDFQALELPYKRHELSMVILLPRRFDDCGQLENRLTPALLSSALAQMQTQTVEVYCPRFTLESSFDLKEILSKMGMSDAFIQPKADFSGLDGIRGLFISGVFHKAWGEINEAGTEAAAATAQLIALGCDEGPPPAPPPVFRADHPFIFLIRDTDSGSLLFVGRLADPSK